MIIGIGTDIVEIARIEALIKKFGGKFLAKNFGEDEIAAAKNLNDATPYFAKRFAAKEAFAKALGTGIGEAAAFKDISTLNDERGAPYIKLAGSAEKTISEIEILHVGKNLNIHVSLSDEKLYAQAFVILEIV